MSVAVLLLKLKARSLLQPLNLDDPRQLSEAEGPVASEVAGHTRRASAATEGSDSLSVAVASLLHLTPIAELVHLWESGCLMLANTYFVLAHTMVGFLPSAPTSWSRNALSHGIC